MALDISTATEAELEAELARLDTIPVDGSEKLEAHLTAQGLAIEEELDARRAAAAEIRARLEYLRGELRAERMSLDELIDLQGLAEHIEPGDLELLEPAGVPEFTPDA